MSRLSVVALNDGQQLDPAALETFIQDELARFKQPRVYRTVHELPRNVMGKVQKAQLRDQFSDLFGA